MFGFVCLAMLVRQQQGCAVSQGVFPEAESRDRLNANAHLATLHRTRVRFPLSQRDLCTVQYVDAAQTLHGATTFTTLSLVLSLSPVGPIANILLYRLPSSYASLKDTYSLMVLV